MSGSGVVEMGWSVAISARLAQAKPLKSNTQTRFIPPPMIQLVQD